MLDITLIVHGLMNGLSSLLMGNALRSSRTPFSSQRLGTRSSLLALPTLTSIGSRQTKIESEMK